MKVFVSYNNRDVDVARRMVEALGRSLSGFDAYFAPRSNIGGAYWLAKLGDELEQSGVVLLLLGGRVGPWQELEYYEALRLSRARGTPVIVPVLLGDERPGLPFLSQFHRLRMDQQPFDALIEQVIAAFEGIDQDGDHVPAWRETNPYRGLLAMGSESAAYFFGREALTAEILNLLRTRPDRVLTLVGNSGVGKSSVAKAGVLSALRARIWPNDTDRSWPVELEHSPSWLTVTIRPGERPLKALALGIARTWLDDPADAEAQALKWVDNFRNGSDLSALLAAARDQIAAQMEAEPPARLLLYVDQAEELYARADAGEAERFSALIAAGVADPTLSVLTSLRSDYYGQLQTDGALFSASDRIDVPPLTRDQLEEVIRKPVEQLGARFETPEIVSLIAEATMRESGALPLLSYMMTEAWDGMRQDEASDGVLRFPGNMVDVARPLAARAERFVDLHADGLDDLKRLFTLRLAHVPKVGDVVRRTATETECTEAEWALAQELATADWRLLTTSDAQGLPTIEVAHEALLRNWTRLQAWLDTEREFLIWKGQVEAARRAWEEAASEKRDSAALMGLPLETARRWREERRGDLSEADAAFIDRSVALEETRREADAHRQQELADERSRSETRRRWITRWAAAAAVVFLVSGVFAAWQWNEAADANNDLESALLAARTAQLNVEHQLFETRVEQMRARAATARLLLAEGRSDEALAVAVAAFPEDSRSDWHEMALRAGAWQPLADAFEQAQMRVRLGNYDGAVASVSFSPDGRQIAITSRQGGIDIWGDANSELIHRLDSAAPLWPGAFSPDSAYLLTVDVDNTVNITNVSTGEVERRLEGHVDEVVGARFSPNGARVATASSEGSVRIWDTATGDLLSDVGVNETPVFDAEFSADGNRLLIGFYDGTARLWDATSGRQIALLAGHDRFVTDVAFSPDESRAATGSADGMARVWDLDSAVELLRLEFFEVVPRSPSNTYVDFSPDGAEIIAYSDLGPGGIWDVATGDRLETFDYSHQVLSSGDNVALYSGDVTIVRNFTSGGIRQIQHPPGELPEILAVSPTGDQIVLLSEDNSVQA